jgi:hypothetical protein
MVVASSGIFWWDWDWARWWECCLRRSRGKKRGSRAEEGKEYAQDMAKELRDRAEKLMERSKQILAQQAGSLNAAVEAGKEAYREKAKV